MGSEDDEYQPIVGPQFPLWRKYFQFLISQIKPPSHDPPVEQERELILEVVDRAIKADGLPPDSNRPFLFIYTVLGSLLLVSIGFGGLFPSTWQFWWCLGAMYTFNLLEFAMMKRGKEKEECTILDFGITLPPFAGYYVCLMEWLAWKLIGWVLGWGTINKDGSSYTSWPMILISGIGVLCTLIGQFYRTLSLYQNPKVEHRIKPNQISGSKGPLITTGLWGALRHPHHMAFFIHGIGHILTLRCPIVGITYALVHFALVVEGIEQEEKLLVQIYPEYRNYAQTTPALCPNHKILEPGTYTSGII